MFWHCRTKHVFKTTENLIVNYGEVNRQ